VTEEQKELVQTSFDKVRPISDVAAVLFYDQLFAIGLVRFRSAEAAVDGRGHQRSNGGILAGWTVSEPAGTPGGTANFDHPGTAPSGISLFATYDKGSSEYVLL
jgi:hypothetical protein